MFYQNISTMPVKRLLQYCDSTRQRGNHDSMLIKAWIHTRRHFTSKVGERAIPASTIEGSYPIFVRQRECHSYYYHNVHYCVIIWADLCLLTGYVTTPFDSAKKWTCLIFVVVVSKLNRNCNSHLMFVLHSVTDLRLIAVLFPCTGCSTHMWLSCNWHTRNVSKWRWLLMMMMKTMIMKQMSYSGSLLIGSHKVVVRGVDEVETGTDSHSPLIHRSTSTWLQLH